MGTWGSEATAKEEHHSTWAAARARREEAEAASAGFVLFSVAWAAYALVHHALTYWRWFHFSGPALLLGGGTVLAALALLLRPSSVPRLAALCAIWTAYKLSLLPDLPNHVLLTLLVNLTLLACLAERLVRRPRGELTAALQARFAPLLRIELLTLYFYAVLHKLNTDYLDPSSSCGWQLYAEMAAAIPLLPTGSWLQLPALLGALCIEALIPLLLLGRRTRTAGVALGVGFHLMLAVHVNEYIASFTAMLFALYTLFLPPAWPVRLRRGWATWAPARWWERNQRRLLVGLAAVGCLAGPVVIHQALHALGKPRLVALVHLSGPLLARTLFAVWATTCVVVLLRLVRADRAAPQRRPRELFAPALGLSLLFPVLVAVNGLSPYIGLKTESSFAMFSNLRTEGGRTNHLFMPVWLRVAGFQEELVTIVDSSDPWLKGARGERVPLFELRRRATASRDPGLFVVFEHRGRLHHYTRHDAGRHPLVQPVSWWAGKLLHFRQVPPEGCPCTCRH